MSRSDFELGRFGGVCALTGEAIAPALRAFDLGFRVVRDPTP